MYFPKGEKTQHIESSLSLSCICDGLRAIVLDSTIDRASGKRVKFVIFTYILITFGKRRREALMNGMSHEEPSLNNKISTTNNMSVIFQSLTTTILFISPLILASTKTFNKQNEKKWGKEVAFVSPLLHMKKGGGWSIDENKKRDRSYATHNPIYERDLKVQMSMNQV